MAKYQDKKKAGNSKIVPFIPGEHYADRHARRLQTNLSAEAVVRSWADENGLRLRINNAGHHWIFDRPGFFAEWWPSSAKLVINRQYQRGIHVHDWTQAEVQLARRLKTAPAPAPVLLC